MFGFFEGFLLFTSNNDILHKNGDDFMKEHSYHTIDEARALEILKSFEGRTVYVKNCISTVEATGGEFKDFCISYSSMKVQNVTQSGSLIDIFGFGKDQLILKVSDDRTEKFEESDSSPGVKISIEYQNIKAEIYINLLG